MFACDNVYPAAPEELYPLLKQQLQALTLLLVYQKFQFSAPKDIHTLPPPFSEFVPFQPINGHHFA
jgi:hypothetical protein